MEEMEAEKREREAKEKEEAEKARKIQEEFRQVDSQWEKDKEAIGAKKAEAKEGGTAAAKDGAKQAEAKKDVEENVKVA